MPLPPPFDARLVSARRLTPSVRELTFERLDAQPLECSISAPGPRPCRKGEPGGQTDQNAEQNERLPASSGVSFRPECRCSCSALRRHRAYLMDNHLALKGGYLVTLGSAGTTPSWERDESCIEDAMTLARRRLCLWGLRVMAVVYPTTNFGNGD